MTANLFGLDAFPSFDPVDVAAQDPVSGLLLGRRGADAAELGVLGDLMASLRSGAQADTAPNIEATKLPMPGFAETLFRSLGAAFYGPQAVQQELGSIRSVPFMQAKLDQAAKQENVRQEGYKKLRDLEREKMISRLAE